MQVDIRSLFAETLRSDAFTQCLESEARFEEVSMQWCYCAYGVLAQLYLDATGDLIGWQPQAGETGAYFLPDREGLMIWSGISLDEIEQLLWWNDQEHRTFEEIAERIEMEWVCL